MPPGIIDEDGLGIAESSRRGVGDRGVPLENIAGGDSSRRTEGTGVGGSQGRRSDRVVHSAGSLFGVRDAEGRVQRWPVDRDDHLRPTTATEDRAIQQLQLAMLHYPALPLLLVHLHWLSHNQDIQEALAENWAVTVQMAFDVISVRRCYTFMYENDGQLQHLENFYQPFLQEVKDGMDRWMQDGGPLVRYETNRHPDGPNRVRLSRVLLDLAWSVGWYMSVGDIGVHRALLFDWDEAIGSPIEEVPGRSRQELLKQEMLESFIPDNIAPLCEVPRDFVAEEVPIPAFFARTPDKGLTPYKMEFGYFLGSGQGWIEGEEENGREVDMDTEGSLDGTDDNEGVGRDNDVDMDAEVVEQMNGVQVVRRVANGDIIYHPGNGELANHPPIIYDFRGAVINPGAEGLQLYAHAGIVNNHTHNHHHYPAPLPVPAPALAAPAHPAPRVRQQPRQPHAQAPQLPVAAPALPNDVGGNANQGRGARLPVHVPGRYAEKAQRRVI